MSVIDDLLNAKEPELRHVEFCTLHSLREEWKDAKAKHTKAKLIAESNRAKNDPSVAAELEAAEAELDELRERIGPNIIRFEFKAIERTEFEELKRGCRPTEQQRTEARKAGQQPPEWNTDTFSPALVAAACVRIKGPSGEADGLSREDAEAIWRSDRWNQAERAELFHTALGAYVSRTDMEGATLGKGSERTGA